jgi:membrane-bound lytic murein transglycosylase A
MRGWSRGVAALLALAALPGCYGIRVATHGSIRPQYTSLARPKIAPDDLDVSGLRRAALASRRYFASTKAKGSYTLGRDAYSNAELARSVDYFVQILDETPPRLLNQRIARECRGYSPVRDVRYTAYYEPILDARLQKDARFRYPIYRKPDDLTLLNLARYYPDDAGNASQGANLLPYLTRAEIDGRGVLAGRGLELAYLDDPVAAFFLHVQGSGRLRLADGRIMRVNYAGSNGLPYRSIGRHMLDSQMIGSGSAGSMRAFLRTASPQVRDQVLFQNPRYIFFREVPLREEDGPIGSLGVPLIPGRSIAADPRYVPPGAVVYIKTKAPVLDTRGNLVGWNELARFTFNHDSGAAIRGPGRADIYWGEGDRAGMAAGYMNSPGDMVVLVCGIEPQWTTTARAATPMVSVAWPEVERALAAAQNP